MADQRDLLAEASPEELQRMLEVDEQQDDNKRRWPQDLAAILRLSEAELCRAGIAAPQAFDLASRIALEIARYGGGRMLYLPQGLRIRTALRDADIWRMFNGKNHHELAQQHGLTVIQIYAILRQQKQLESAKRQGRLFDNQEKGKSS